MPTDEETTDVNASKQTEEVKETEGEETETLPAETLTEDAVKAHPKYKELEEKHAAARTGMDESNVSKKELKSEIARLKVLAGEEETETEEEEKPLTRAELNDKLWLLQNAKDIEIYSDEEYEKDIADGIPKEYALKTAKLRGKSDPDKVRLENLKQTASGSSANNRELESDEITEKDRKGQKKWGYSDKAILKQKQLKKERGQI